MVRRTIVAGVLALAVTAGFGGFAIEGLAQGGAPAARPAAPLIDLNTATTADLERLPGVGAATAARIVEYRTRNGAFGKIEDLMNVQGIGEKKFLDLRSRITVTSTAKPGA